MAKRRKKYSDIVSKHVRNPLHISGIYNYCDRWCERCPMTLRCSTFAITQEHYPDTAARDANNERFWEKRSEVFRGTAEMIREDAKRRGIDLDADPAGTEAFLAAEKRRGIEAEEHECTVAAKQYGKMVDKWFKSAKPLFRERKAALESQARMRLPGADPIGEAARLKDVVEVAQFYQHFVWVKLMRAVDGLLGETEDKDLAEILKGFPKDSDGSAKITLIGLDRSISAWSEIRSQFPDDADRILDILVHLDRLRRSVEKTFPDARAFVRPGFDDRPVASTSTHHGNTETRRKKN